MHTRHVTEGWQRTAGYLAILASTAWIIWFLGRPWLNPQQFVGQPVSTLQGRYGQPWGPADGWDQGYDINCPCGLFPVDSYYLVVEVDAQGIVTAADLVCS